MASPLPHMEATTTTKKTIVPDDSTEQVKAIKKMVRDLQERYNDARLDESDAGRSARASVAGQLRRLSHDMIHPEEQYIQLEVPPAVTGEPFKINDTEYSGTVVVPACVASTLLYMMHMNRAVDLERMRESGRTIDLGSIAARARIIQQEN